jgi:hypothetical protein
MVRRLLLLVLGLAATLAIVSTEARAAGGNYSFVGGTPSEQGQVRAGLNASRFDWSRVPGQVTIHIERGLTASHSLPGQIWLDADLLDSGRFSWGTVQMEYAHQVHFLLLDDGQRADLTSALGAKTWCWDRPGLTHADNGCERFAAMLAWAYWPSAANCMQPSGPTDESAAMAPATFRSLLGRLLGLPATPLR